MGDSIFPYACAMEMIHTSSLIMDDIMDNDDVRRGQMTCHTKYGLGMALMASQFICSAAYVILQNNRYCMKDVLHTVRQMCIGQSEEVAEWKTGSLIRSCVRVGAILGGASEEQLIALSIYGNNIGYLFQMRDDQLDGDRPDGELELDLTCLDIFGEKAENLRKIARFIVERTV